MNRPPSTVLLLGRLLVGALFLVAGLRKAMSIAPTAGYMAKNGVPMAEVLVYGAVLLEILGGLALILGWKTRAVAWVLAIFVIVITPIFHGFWTFPPEQFVGKLNHFLKNLAVIGGLFYIASLGAGSISLDKK